MKVSAFITVLALAYRRDQINWTTRIVGVAVFTFSAAAAAQNLVWAPVGPSPTTAGTDTGVVEEPAQIRGVDLKTGNTLWVAPIRDIVDRTSPPP